MKNLTFRNQQTNEVFNSNQINEMPSGLYNCLDLHWLTLLVTYDRNVLVASFDHGLAEEALEEFESAIVPIEYFETDRHGIDFLIKKGLIEE